MASGLAFAAPDAPEAPEPPSDPIARLLTRHDLAGGPTDAAAIFSTSDAAHAVEPAPTTAPGLLRSVQERASGMVASAMALLGVPYKRGGNSSETGFDCSGFTRHVVEGSLGLLLPRRAEEQARSAKLIDVPRADLQPGDLVFFNTLKRTFSHVGIYVGDNRFIHAPSAGKDVRVEDMGFAYWAKRFTGARRVEGPAKGE